MAKEKLDGVGMGVGWPSPIQWVEMGVGARAPLYPRKSTLTAAYVDEERWWYNVCSKAIKGGI